MNHEIQNDDIVTTIVLIHGSKFFKVYQNPVTMSPFLIFFTYSFLPCKYIFMNDYDQIYNCNSLKYRPSKIFDQLLNNYF
jgi:hypothetical protein